MEADARLVRDMLPHPNTDEAVEAHAALDRLLAPRRGRAATGLYVIATEGYDEPELIGPFGSASEAAVVDWGNRNLGFDHFWVVDIERATVPREFLVADDPDDPAQPEDEHSAVIVRTRTLRALLDYVQPDEEHDVLLNDNDNPGHIVYAIRELRHDIDKADDPPDERRATGLYAACLNTSDSSKPDDFWIEFYWADDHDHAEEQATDSAGDADAIVCVARVPQDYVREPAADSLALWFTPQCIRDHFDGDPGGLARSVETMSDAQLAQAGLDALSMDALYEAFHRCLVDALTDLRIKGGA